MKNLRISNHRSIKCKQKLFLLSLCVHFLFAVIVIGILFFVVYVIKKKHNRGGVRKRKSNKQAKEPPKNVNLSTDNKTHFSNVHHNIPLENDVEPNVTESELKTWRQYYKYQEKLAQTPLFDGLCYKCGTLLFSSPSGHTFAKLKLPDEQIAPITCMYTSLPNIPYECDNGKSWKCCYRCHNGAQPCPLIGNPNTNIVDQPSEIMSLKTAAQKRAISLCSIFSSTFRQRQPYWHQWRHIVGTIDVARKTSRHYYGMFGYYTSKYVHDMVATWEQTDICKALTWLKANNPFYRYFLCTYETLYRWHINTKEAFHNPEAMHTAEGDNVSKQLQDEQDGLVVPIDSINDVLTLFQNEDIVGQMKPQSRCLPKILHNEKVVACKIQ